MLRLFPWIGYFHSSIVQQKAAVRARLTLKPPCHKEDPIVTFLANTVTGAQTVVATGVGTATIEVTVRGFDGSIVVPVTVKGVGD